MGLLDELAAELGTDSDSLRSALLAGGQDSETLSPIDFTIDPSGQIGIAALRLKAPTTRIPPAGDGQATISWTRDDTGALVADIRSYVDKAALQRDRINLFLETLGQGAAIKMVDVAQSNAAEIDVTAGAVTKKLLAQDGTSDFTQAVGAFRVYRNAAQVIPGATVTAIGWDTKTLDISTWFSLATGRFTPQIPGIYYVHLSAFVQAIPDQKRVQAIVEKNGAFLAVGSDPSSVAGQMASQASTLVQMNGTTDYLTGHCWQEDAANHDLTNDPTATWFEGFLIGTL